MTRTKEAHVQKRETYPPHQAKSMRARGVASHPPMIMYATRPIHPPENTMVRIEAPALSPAVISGSLRPLSPLPEPALGSPLLLPPVLEVTGALSGMSITRRDVITSVAMTCSSSPFQPSHFFWYHRTLQVLFFMPVQDAAAASAEPCSLGRI